jgi:glutathione synthase/RimK-type ligase-like ATP-grasp enzyme
LILVITSKRDGHIHSVTRHFDAARLPWVRINTEDFARNIELNIEPAAGIGSIWVRDSNRSFDLDAVNAVWYRKPDPLDLSHFKLDRPSLDYIEAEFNEVLQGIYALCNKAFWINNPLTSRLAHRKMLQLNIAQAVGFKTPPSIITNRIQDALNFAESVNWDIAVKSLGAIVVSNGPTNYGIFTRRIGKQELLALQDKISYMPTLFQQYIEKEYELRVTCVGEKIYACRIFSQDNDSTREDFRFDARNLRHELCECPEIADKLLNYLRALGLNFGCFDIAYSKSKEFVFFECNPNGQWRWIEELAGAPIGKAIADMLIAAAYNDR